MKMQQMKSLKQHAQAGFTLIELVVVIVILGILAATALPRFFDLTGDARKASVKGSAGSFMSAVALVHAKWLVQGSDPTKPIVVDTKTVVMSTAGYPGLDTPSVDGCKQIWTDILSTPNNEYTATVDTGNAKACKYAYTNDATKYFTYDATTGLVVITAP